MVEMETIGTRIKNLRKDRNWTQFDLAKKLQGVSHAAISQWESDTTKPNADNLYDLSIAFNCDVKWLLKGGESENKKPQISLHKLDNIVKIPVFTLEELKIWDSVESFDYSTANEFIMSDIFYSENTLSFKISDDSMLPDFMEGDLIIISPDLRPLPGEFVAVLYNRIVLFRKFKEIEDNRFMLLPLNQDYAQIIVDITKVRIIGTMVEHRIYRRKR